jgi:type II secretory pathway component PulF
VVRQLERLLRSGQPVPTALASLAAASRSAPLRASLGTLVAGLKGGLGFGTAAGRCPELFSALDSYLLDTGDRTGTLPEVLAGIARNLDRSIETRRGIIKASAYPLFLLVASSLLLPLPTLVGSSGVAGYVKSAGSGLGLIALAVLAIVMLPRLLRNSSIRDRAISLSWSVPGLGTLVRSAALARMFRTFATALSAGLGVPETLELAARNASNDRISLACRAVAVRIEAGEELAQALAGTGLLQDETLLSVAGGETSGTLPEAFVGLADEAEKAVDNRIAWSLRIGGLLVLMITMGIVASRILDAFSGMMGGPEGDMLREIEREMPGVFQRLPAK